MRKSGHLDRAAGVMVGLACGDALGAAYEFGGPYPADMAVKMKKWRRQPSDGSPANGPMTLPWQYLWLELIASGERPRGYNLRSAVKGWIEWMQDAKDVGNQTSSVLGEARRASGGDFYELDTAAMVAAREFQEQFPDAAGNGSLMRTAPFMVSPGRILSTSRSLPRVRASSLTHMPMRSPLAPSGRRRSSMLWTPGNSDIRVGLRAVVSETNGSDRFALWETRIREAERFAPEHFTQNGWVVQALQGAWSSIVHSGDRADNDPRHVRRALEMAGRGGGDTDTVAAIAGGLIGAAYGVSAIPLEWKRRIDGWPGWRADELVEHAITATRVWKYYDEKLENSWPTIDYCDYSDWRGIDTCIPHPSDPGVYLGGIGALDKLPSDVDAVVSLCRVGRRQVPDSVDREDSVSVWLVDSDQPEEDQYVDFVLSEAADMIARMRKEGKTVLLHCVQAHSRTPTVGALYAARHLGVSIDDALREVTAVLPLANPNPNFVAAIRRITLVGNEE